jgi:hypothetical protein
MAWNEPIHEKIMDTKPGCHVPLLQNNETILAKVYRTVIHKYTNVGVKNSFWNE